MQHVSITPGRKMSITTQNPLKQDFFSICSLTNKQTTNATEMVTVEYVTGCSSLLVVSEDHDMVLDVRTHGTRDLKFF